MVIGLNISHLVLSQTPNCTLLTKGCPGSTGSILELGNCKKFREDAGLEGSYV